MASTTSAGTTLAVSLNAPATWDEVGYLAMTFTEVGGVESIAAFGATTAVNSFQPLNGAQDKHKGPTNHGSLQVPMALDKNDVGQAIVEVLATPGNNALGTFQITFPNGDRRFFGARVFGLPETPGSATNVLMRTAAIEIVTPVAKVDLSGGGLDLTDFSNLLMLGDML
jgi:hypothetical protein